MPLNWVMQPFILLPGTGHIRLKLSTSLPLLCEFKHPQVSTAFRPFVSPLEVQSYAVPMFLRRCLHVEIMIQARNHTHILKRNEMFTVLCHLREEDNNILEWFFFSLSLSIYIYIYISKRNYIHGGVIQCMRQMVKALLECWWLSEDCMS